MTQPSGTRVLDALLDRLYGALLRGPAINCTPGRSRQRFDLALLERLDDAAPSDFLGTLLGPDAKARLTPKYDPVPPHDPAAKEPEDPELKRRRAREEEKRRLVRNLATIASDTDLYLKETGVYVLYVGYPLLSFRGEGGGARGPSRVLAPLAFFPVDLTVRPGPRGAITLACREGGDDRVQANIALKTWVEAQMGIPYPDLFQDEEGEDPLRELTELTQHVAKSMGIAAAPDLAGWPLELVPATGDLPDKPTILPSAVMGLYHLRNQNTIKDIEEMRTAEALPSTVSPFLTLREALTSDGTEAYAEADGAAPAVALPSSAEEHLLDRADPCQRRAVLAARTTRGLVVHGPPGTGKSQTITNVIGDYLARQKRVLMVCEKRTALDVVKFRLDAKGLGPLCAVVHDAVHDRRDLYMGVRDQLDNLANQPLVDDPARRRAQVDAEIDRLNGELAGIFGPMVERDAATGADFHELVGRWLQADGAARTAGGAAQSASKSGALDEAALRAVAPEELIAAEADLRGAFERLLAANFAENAWADAHGLTLDAFLARPMTDVRAALERCIAAADEAGRANPVGIPPYAADRPLEEQGAYREATLARLEKLAGAGEAALREAMARLEARAVAGLRQALVDLEPMRELAASGAPDAELAMTYKAAPMKPKELAAAMGNLADYAARGGGFFAIFLFGLKKEVRRLLAPFGLPLSPATAARVRSFLQGVQARHLLRDALHERLKPEAVGELSGDDDLLRAVEQARGLADFLAELDANPAGAPLRAEVRRALVDEAARTALSGKLRGAKAGAAAIAACLEALAAAGLFSEAAKGRFGERARAGAKLDATITALRDDLDRLEPLLRYESTMAGRPAALDAALRALAAGGCNGEAAWSALMAAAYRGALDRRLAAAPQLARADETGIDEALGRLADLSAEKNDLVAGGIRAAWQRRQRERLLASTGNRLNTLGADLRRRLLLRGKNASRIREVVHNGLSTEGGDPLFDIQPVWMTSPETAAQIFPLQPIFDVVVFDEASQCRLEEGLPALARGASVVIAGDTKQLPPTRFFESAIATTADDDGEELDGMEALFQSQQSEIEDLLSAALNIEIEQSFLDVHYRSRHAELIAFSNEAFYGSRLQAVPGHPNGRGAQPPIVMHRCEGVYEERSNAIEARQVVERVRELLAGEAPPSIGIACFNLPQKDLIDGELERVAEEDKEFAGRLATARERRRDGAFEGLFVKNLENVQGDERDFILISTTYGPTAAGKFYRRFGPLATAGGERRLNVIVTRSRQQVELFTSIPSAVYRQMAAAAVPEGDRPNGAYYLAKYLCAAEDMERNYAASAAAPPAQLEARLTPARGVSSAFVEEIARRLREEHGVASARYYGNEGFCVDLALGERAHPEHVAVGVLCDVNRFAKAQDRVEWELFKRGILRWQKWDLRRVWTPRFLRDPEGVLRQLAAQAGAAAPKA